MGSSGVSDHGGRAMSVTAAGDGTLLDRRCVEVDADLWVASKSAPWHRSPNEDP
jgi:hypothetical protein